jgi:K+-transporting ATPase KdpF subunit
VSREAWSARRPTRFRALEHLMISVENLIGLIGAVALVVYLFMALTHPEWF